MLRRPRSKLLLMTAAIIGFSGCASRCGRYWTSGTYGNGVSPSYRGEASAQNDSSSVRGGIGLAPYDKQVDGIPPDARIGKPLPRQTMRSDEPTRVRPEQIPLRIPQNGSAMRAEPSGAHGDMRDPVPDPVEWQQTLVPEYSDAGQPVNSLGAHVPGAVEQLKNWSSIFQRSSIQSDELAAHIAGITSNTGCDPPWKVVKPLRDRQARCPIAANDRQPIARPVGTARTCSFGAAQQADKTILARRQPIVLSPPVDLLERSFAQRPTMEPQENLPVWQRDSVSFGVEIAANRTDSGGRTALQQEKLNDIQGSFPTGKLGPFQDAPASSFAETWANMPREVTDGMCGSNTVGTPIDMTPVVPESAWTATPNRVPDPSDARELRPVTSQFEPGVGSGPEMFAR